MAKFDVAIWIRERERKKIEQIVGVKGEKNRAHCAKSTKFDAEVPWDKTIDLSRDPTKKITIFPGIKKADRLTEYQSVMMLDVEGFGGTFPGVCGCLQSNCSRCYSNEHVSSNQEGKPISQKDEIASWLQVTVL